jgi:hypothetical protein
MHGRIGSLPLPPSAAADSGSTVKITVAARAQVECVAQWRHAFASERKDWRFYEIVEDTIRGDYNYGYLLIRRDGDIVAVQPYFMLDQDLLAGIGGIGRSLAQWLRRCFPRFMRARTLMLGCVAGEAHLDGDAATHAATAQALADALPGIAHDLGASLIVLKEFPARYRGTLQCFRDRGFARVPSMPMTKLDIGYVDFADYVSKALSPRTRGKLRRKLRDSDRADPPITMTVVNDATPFVEDIYPLYLDVYERSTLKFEKLTKEFFASLGQRMPDKVRFFLWRAGGQLIAFNLCMLQGDRIFSEYIGFDYGIAYDVNLYYRVFRDIVVWAMQNGCKQFASSSLNYDPKWHLRQSLDPIDLYVRHTSPIINAALKRALPLMEPTRYDKVLPNFPNYRELWG